MSAVRFVLIGVMLAVLCIVLYIPSTVPAQTFIEVIREEHRANQAALGEVVSHRVLARMLDWQQVVPPVSEPPAATQVASPGSPVDSAVAQQVAQVSARLFSNPYFQSIDALFALVAYRVSALLEVLAVLLVFAIAAFTDGMVIRLVRSKEFVPHSAELFGASILAAIALSGAAMVAVFMPFRLHPYIPVICLLLTVFCLSRAVANYAVIR